MKHENEANLTTTETTTFTDGQRKAFDLAMKGGNVFVTGGAGTGKSFLIREIISHMKRSGKQVVACAPTGTAASAIGGSTIHRVLGISAGRAVVNKGGKPALTSRSSKVLEKCDAVVIDEISMVRMDLFDALAKAIRAAEKKAKRKIQVVVVGDFFQLPPVIDERRGERRLLESLYGREVGNGYAFEGLYWDEFGFETVALDEIVRQTDSEFASALNSVRAGDPTILRWFNDRCFGKRPSPDATYLTGRNAVADDINSKRIAELPGEATTFKADIDGTVSEQDMAVPVSLTLKEGTRVMCVINDADGKFSNGSTGTVLQIVGRDYVQVRFDDGTKKLFEKQEWRIIRYEVEPSGKIAEKTCGSYRQLPFRPAYAITIHKSQGMTLDSVTLDPWCWSPGQLYVALSRVRRAENLVLTEPVNLNYLKTDFEVKRLYETIPVIEESDESEPLPPEWDDETQTRPFLDIPNGIEEDLPFLPYDEYEGKEENPFLDEAETPAEETAKEEFFEIRIPEGIEEPPFFSRPANHSYESPVEEATVSYDGRVVPFGLKKELSGKKVGRPTPFENGTKRVRLPVELADELVEMAKEWAERKKYPNGSVIRQIPKELDEGLAEFFVDWENGFGNEAVAYVPVPLELEGRIRREIEVWKKTGGKENAYGEKRNTVG